MKRLALYLVTASFAATAWAQQPAPPAAGPEPPVLPGAVESGAVMEPEVTIRETRQGTVEEYRAGGRLYLVKITPRGGRPYYLLDTDGDGWPDTQRNDPLGISVPQWLLFSW